MNFFLLGYHQPQSIYRKKSIDLFFTRYVNVLQREALKAKFELKLKPPLVVDPSTLATLNVPNLFSFLPSHYTNKQNVESISCDSQENS